MWGCRGWTTSEPPTVKQTGHLELAARSSSFCTSGVITSGIPSRHFRISASVNWGSGVELGLSMRVG
jgi:hypothetical protein